MQKYDTYPRILYKMLYTCSTIGISTLTFCAKFHNCSAFTNPSTTSSECPTCGTLEWRTDFLPSQQRIVEFQTRLLIPCRNQTFESVDLECTNQTVFS